MFRALITKYLILWSFARLQTFQNIDNKLTNNKNHANMFDVIQY